MRRPRFARGWRRRTRSGKSSDGLGETPSMLLLDDPTNHLHLELALANVYTGIVANRSLERTISVLLLLGGPGGTSTRARGAG